MIVLSKLIPFMVYPLGIAIELVLIAMLCFYKKKKTAGYVLLWLSVFILLFFSSQITAYEMAKILERSYMPVEPGRVKADVIVTLGGTTRPKMYPRRNVEFNEGAERILETVRLYKAGAAPVIVTSGGGIDFILKGQKEGDDMQEALVELGVPADVIISEDKSRNTHENAVYVKKLIDKKKMGNRIILVTSAIHMIRSVSVFKKVGFDVIPAPVDYYVEDNEYSWFHFLPRVENLMLSTMVLKEMIGFPVYKAMGWL